MQLFTIICNITALCNIGVSCSHSVKQCYFLFLVWVTVVVSLHLIIFKLINRSEANISIARTVTFIRLSRVLGFYIVFNNEIILQQLLNLTIIPWSPRTSLYTKYSTSDWPHPDMSQMWESTVTWWEKVRGDCLLPSKPSDDVSSTNNIWSPLPWTQNGTVCRHSKNSRLYGDVKCYVKNSGRQKREFFYLFIMIGSKVKWKINAK